MDEVRTLHGDLCRDDRVVGSWSAKWLSLDPREPDKKVHWDCHVTIGGQTERFTVKMPRGHDDLQVMQETIGRGQIAHMARRSVRRARQKEQEHGG